MQAFRIEKFQLPSRTRWLRDRGSMACRAGCTRRSPAERGWARARTPGTGRSFSPRRGGARRCPQSASWSSCPGRPPCSLLVGDKGSGAGTNYRCGFPYLVTNSELILTLKMTLRPGKLGHVKTLLTVRGNSRDWKSSPIFIWSQKASRGRGTKIILYAPYIWETL